MGNTNIAYKFVKHDIAPLESYTHTFPYRIKEKLLNGGILTREEKNELANKLSTSDSKTLLKLMGWAYSFRTFLNEYWVEFTYGDIHRYYALDKTSLRKCLSSVNRIVEVTKAKKIS